jgi:transcriptional regulator GlxA family with amidase domain
MQLVAATSLPDIAATQLDTLVAAGGDGVRAAIDDGAVVAAVREAAPRARRTASVCSGVFVLAAAGLLDGKRATTHWNSCDLLADLYPTTTVDADAIFVRDGRVSTSAGITTGIDLALAFVEEDHGHALAARVARQLVVFLQRPGGQSQFSVYVDVPPASRGTVRHVQAWVADHLTDDLSVQALAAQAGMSVRNFSRVFRAETGTTPADFVEAARTEAAKHLLQTSDAGLAEIAHTVGHGSVETLHRVFRRRLGVTPTEFRRRFGPVGPVRPTGPAAPEPVIDDRPEMTSASPPLAPVAR